ncbi:immunoglobulin domain-containing protein [Pelagicoccus sp. SDUM812002]|uniref:immunoglobulin domain-containing protein n=1 Tax=Pelagicoccus sp. SDUM812002 TaxID=3041266 RepID=UPI00280DB7B2|nr:immunoglobulin domain-containing protein [Pelagicoccus sp. SDUM812002]MDQ8184366.1 immunoglobulin domain-containing protein [Pelagicoccus sp. SDUM812002]
MKTKKTTIFIILISCICFSSTVHGQRYGVGDIVDNFTLINRETNQPVSLHELEGKVVFLEWFAYWCPFCQAAAEDVKNGIVDYYIIRNGNANGVPVLHVGINLEGGAGAEAFTRAFVNRYGLELVLNDFDRSLANRFQSGGQPIFAIINGVKNSPNAEQWELLYSRLGYGDFSQPISTFRQVIDSIQAASGTPLPLIQTQPQSARLGTGSNVILSVSATGEQLAYQWFRDEVPLPNQTTSTLFLENVSLDNAGSYSITVSNAGGEVNSETAHVEVVQSLRDYLVQSGLAGGDLAPEADPDHDGHPNAFEYLAQSDPNSLQDVPETSNQIIQNESVTAIRIQFRSSSETIGYQLSAHFWSEPSKAGSITHTLPLGQNSGIIQPVPVNAKTYLARLQASPSM